MFWKEKGPPDAKEADLHGAFEIAKEATRRATFLNVRARMPQGDSVKQELALLFRVCRTKALETGAAIGLSQAEVDAKIAALCDEDVARLKNSSDDEFRDFVRDSGKIVTAFLARLDLEAAMTALGSKADMAVASLDVRY